MASDALGNTKDFVTAARPGSLRMLWDSRSWQVFSTSRLQLAPECRVWGGESSDCAGQLSALQEPGWGCEDGVGAGDLSSEHSSSLLMLCDQILAWGPGAITIHG